MRLGKIVVEAREAHFFHSSKPLLLSLLLKTTDVSFLRQKRHEVHAEDKPHEHARQYDRRHEAVHRPEALREGQAAQHCEDDDARDHAGAVDVPGGCDAAAGEVDAVWGGKGG